MSISNNKYPSSCLLTSFPLNSLSFIGRQLFLMDCNRSDKSLFSKKGYTLVKTFKPSGVPLLAAFCPAPGKKPPVPPPYPP